MTPEERALVLTIGAVLESLLRRAPGNENEIRVLADALTAVEHPTKDPS